MRTNHSLDQYHIYCDQTGALMDWTKDYGLAIAWAERLGRTGNLTFSVKENGHEIWTTRREPAPAELQAQREADTADVNRMLQMAGFQPGRNAK